MKEITHDELVPGQYYWILEPGEEPDVVFVGRLPKPKTP